jgi:hypothetical protein
MSDTTPLEALDAWPWPRWEFVTAMPTYYGITVALVPHATCPQCLRLGIDPDTLATVYDSRVIMVDQAGRSDGRATANARANR